MAFYKKNYNKGYTLFETVVALGVILGALFGPVSLIVRGIYSFSYAKNKLMAVNLAQEGIELARMVRENNQICLKDAPGWSAGHDWKTDFDGSSGSSMVGTGRRVDATDMISYVCGGNMIHNTKMQPGCDSIPLRLDSGGKYGYDISGQESIFYRCIDINNVSGSESTSRGAPITPPNMFDVTSTVTWNERGMNRTLVFTQRFYNWQ